MTICQACSAEIAGPDRFCRNCGAPVATLVGDLVDTNRFNPTAPLAANAQPRSLDPTGTFYVPPAAASPTAQVSPPSHQAGSVVKKLMHRKIVWPVIFLLLLVFIVTGMAVGRRALRALRRSVPVDTGRARPGDVAERGETARLSFEESVQNALGLKPGSISDAEYPDVRGIFVAGLMSDDSPAALADIQAGDVLMELSGQVVRNSGELAQVLKSLQPGAEVGVKLYRDGEAKPSLIKIADPSNAPFQPKLEPRDMGFLGVDEVSRRCCIPGTKRWGVEIIKLTDNSPADLAGLHPGDVITEFDKHAVRTPYEFSRRIVAAKPRSKVMVKFYRGNTEQTAELIMGHRVTDRAE